MPLLAREVPDDVGLGRVGSFGAVERGEAEMFRLEESLRFATLEPAEAIGEFFDLGDSDGVVARRLSEVNERGGEAEKEARGEGVRKDPLP